MAIAASHASSIVEVSVGRWLAAVNRSVLWGGLLLLIVYPLSMVVVAAFAPALVDDQTVRFSDFFTERLLTAWTNTFRLGLAVSLMSLAMGGLAALLAAQTKHDRWIDLLMSVPFSPRLFWLLWRGVWPWGVQVI